MNTITEFITTIKRELLFEVIANMKQKAMPGENARDLAREFLQSAPFTSKEDVLEKLFTLGARYEEARAVFLKYAPGYYEEKRLCVLNNIRESVQHGDLEGAIPNAYWRCTS